MLARWRAMEEDADADCGELRGQVPCEVVIFTG